MSLDKETRLGPYKILGPLGAGGMGEVYKARDTRLDRLVAIKVVPEHLADNATLRQRLEREARAVSSLNHPHICTLHDIGRQDQIDYLVLEYLEGETLAQRLEKGPVERDAALDIAAQTTAALAAAHGKGVVHRDLKPGNIMLTASGVKLLDFGLAKPTATSEASTDLTASPTLTSPLTAAGTIVGTFQYMAPEQVEGGEADARTDIFALGCILYEMLSGRRAFAGKTQASVIAKVLETQPASLVGQCEQVSPALDRLLLTCLAKNPDERWQSARDLEREIRWLLDPRSAATDAQGTAAERGTPSSSGAGAKTGRPFAALLPWGLAAVLGLACIVLAALFFSPADPTPPPEPIFANILAPAGGSFLSTSLQAGPVSLSPDGRRMVFLVRDDKSGDRLWLRDLSESVARPLEGTDRGTRAFWSPDSRSIGFFSDGRLRRMDISGSIIMDLAEAPDPRGGSWSRHNQIIFTPNFIGPVHVVDAGGGPSRPVTRMDEQSSDATHRYPFFLPDGRHFLYLAREKGLSPGRTVNLEVGHVDEDFRLQLVSDASNAAYDQGHLLYLSGSDLMAQPFDPEALQTTGPARPLVQGVRLDRRFSLGVFSAGGGNLAYQLGEGQSSLVSIYDRKGSLVRNLGEPAMYGDPRISPDQTKVSFTVIDPGTGLTDIWVHHLEHDLRSRLTFGGVHDSRNAVWSDDSETIFFQRVEGREQQLQSMSVSGRGTPQTLAGIPVAVNLTDAHTSSVVFNNFGTGGSTVGIIDLDGNHEPSDIVGQPMGRGSSAWGGVVSPDGRWLAYASDETGQAEIYVAPFPDLGGRWQISRNGGEEVAWKADGSELYFLSLDFTVMAVPLREQGSGLTVGKVESLFRLSLASNTGTRFDAFADGQRFLINRTLGETLEAPVTVLLNWKSLLDKR